MTSTTTLFDPIRFKQGNAHGAWIVNNGYPPLELTPA